MGSGTSRPRRIDPWQRAGEVAQARDGGRLPSKLAKYGGISEIVGNAAGRLERLTPSVASQGRNAFLLRDGQPLATGSAPFAPQYSGHLRRIHGTYYTWR